MIEDVLHAGSRLDAGECGNLSCVSYRVDGRIPARAEWRPVAGRTTAEKPIVVAAYQAGRPKAFLEPLAVGDVLPDVPLFLDNDSYIYVPLEATYTAAYSGMPERWRKVIEGRSA